MLLQLYRKSSRKKDEISAIKKWQRSKNTKRASKQNKKPGVDKNSFQYFVKTPHHCQSLNANTFNLEDILRILLSISSKNIDLKGKIKETKAFLAR